MTNDGRLIIVASSEGGKDYEILKRQSGAFEDSPSLFYIKSKTVKVKKNVEANEISSFDFVFIRDDDHEISVGKEINEIIQLTNRNNIAIVVHKTGGKMTEVENFLSSLEARGKKIYRPVEFHHIDDSKLEPIWNRGLKPLVESIEYSFQNYDKYFNSFWNNLISDDIKPTNLLASLDILLQGYLIIRYPKAILERNISRIVEEYNILHEGSDRKREAMKKTEFQSFPSGQRLFRPSNIKGNPSKGEPSGTQDLGWFWFDECLPDVKESSYDSLAERYYPLKGKESLKKVWDLLRGESLGESGGLSIATDCQEWDQKKFTALFEEAHREYVSIFDQKD